MSDCNNSPTIFDLLDNFFDGVELTHAKIVCFTDKTIWQFGEQIRLFYSMYEVVPKQKNEYRAFFGGYLSNNLNIIEHNQYLLNAMIYCHSVLIPCPLHNWFCNEQYLMPSLLSKNTPTLSGYLILQNNGDTSINYQGTRIFLSRFLPVLYSLRPLIENQKVILFPYQKYAYEQRSAVEKLTSLVSCRENLSLESVTSKFDPIDMTVEDMQKGLFILAGGEIENSIRSSIKKCIKFFSRDYVTGNYCEGVYTAPYRWESYLCNELTNEGLVGTHPGRMTVIQAIQSSTIPYLTQLSIEKIIKIQSMDEFNLFRKELMEYYGKLEPYLFKSDFKVRLREIEEDIIYPVINKIEIATNSSLFSRTINAVKQGGLKLAETYLSGEVAKHILTNPESLSNTMLLSLPSAIFETIKGFNSVTGLSGPQKVWATLMRDTDSKTLFDGSVERSVSTGDFRWFPENRNPMSVSVLSGVVLNAFSQNGEENDLAMQQPQQSPQVIQKPAVGRNEKCPCNSGKKYKYCCGKNL